MLTSRNTTTRAIGSQPNPAYDPARHVADLQLTIRKQERRISRSADRIIDLELQLAKAEAKLATIARTCR